MSLCPLNEWRECRNDCALNCEGQCAFSFIPVIAGVMAEVDTDDTDEDSDGHSD